MMQPPHSSKYLDNERHADEKSLRFQKPPTALCAQPAKLPKPPSYMGAWGNLSCFQIDKSCSIAVTIHPRMFVLLPCPALKEIV